MLNLRMTLNNIEIPTSHILDSLTFETSMTSQDFTIGDFLFTTVKTKFLNDTVINYGDIIKIYIIDEDKGIVYPYGIYMPYDIKKNQFAREIEFYPELIIKLMRPYIPLFTSNYTTRSLLIEMMAELGFNVKELENVQGVNMEGTQEEWGKARTGMEYLQYIASLIGKNVLVNRNGEIEFKLQRETDFILNKPQITKLEEGGESTYFISGIKVVGDNTSDVIETGVLNAPDNAIRVTQINNPFCKSETVARSMYNTLATLQGYQAWKIKYFNFPVYLDVLDVVYIENDNPYELELENNTGEELEYEDGIDILLEQDGKCVYHHSVPIMKLKLSFSRGGLVAELESTLANINSKQSVSTGSITSRLDIINNINRELNTKVEILDGSVSSLITQTEVIVQNTQGQIKDLNDLINNLDGKIDDEIDGIRKDLDDEMITIIDKQSSMQQTIDGFTTRVENTETNLSENYLTREQTISQIEQTSSSIVQSVISEEVGKLSVGARNFILNSNVETTVASPITTDIAMYEWKLSQDTPFVGIQNKNDNAQFTISIWTDKGSNAFTSVLIGGITLYATEFTIMQLEQNLFRYTKTFTVARDAMLANDFFINIICQGTLNHSSIIKFLQLEEGSLATSYQQPLEDVVSDFDTKIEETIQDIVNGNQEIQNAVQDILSDDFISDSERADLVLIFKEITSQYDNIIKEVDDYGDENKNYFSTFTDALTSSYTAFSEALSAVVNNNDTSGKVALQELLATYYDDYHQLLYVISQFVKSEHERLETEIIQTNESITNVITRVDDEFNERKKYMRFGEDGLELFTTINGEIGLFKMQLTENRLSFYEGTNEVAYMSNEKLYISNAEITTSLQIGNVVGRKSANEGFVFHGKKE